MSAAVRGRGHLIAAGINLNHPDHYFHWSFVVISVANLIVIAIMVAVFIAALALPFMRARTVPAPAGVEGETEGERPAPDQTRTWTGAVRRVGLRFLPPGKLLPDFQPAYVASWAYVFGVATVASLVIVIASGLSLAFEGPAWWHVSTAGHLVNSIHLWSVELFMGFMTVHLWAKFWMAAWRGRRQATWITGVLCFLVAVFEAFSGYISQTNFDSQWIAFESKDAFNSAGIGAFINPMNFGQALMLHITLVPVALLLLVGAHVLLVRVRGVVPPIDARADDLAGGESAPQAGKLSRRQRAHLERQPWRGPLRHYDIIKEASIATVLIAVVSVGLAFLLSSPDKRPVTLQQWAQAEPSGFIQVAVTELDGSSTSAGYGPPFNNADGSVQSLGPVSLQKFFGISWPLDPAKSFVLDPLHTLPPNATLTGALDSWQSAAPAQQTAWTKAYEKAVGSRSLSAPPPSSPPAGTGPVPAMLSSLLDMARSGGLDAALLSHASFYGSDYTDPLMFLGDSATSQDSGYWNRIVTAEHLQGSQWGVMNETGSWPGQPWLWLYSMWYQVPPMNNSGNADILVVAIMAVLSLALLLLPFIPGLRSIPRWIPLHRVIWRQYYNQKYYR